MEKFIASLLSLFITLDPIGTIPFYLTYTHSFSEMKKHRILFISISVCFFVSVLSLFWRAFIQIS